MTERKTLSVFLAEDEPGWIDIVGSELSGCLEEMGVNLKLSTAEDYQTASKAVRAERHDLRFFDWNLAMPGQGKVYTEPLIRKSLSEGIPTVVISGSGRSLQDFKQRLGEEGLSLPIIQIDKSLYEPEDIRGPLRQLLENASLVTRKIGCGER